MNSRKKKNGIQTQISVMKTEVNFISETVKRIEENTKGLPTVANDVDWLKYWHNKIVVGLLAAIVLSGTLAIFQIIGK